MSNFPASGAPSGAEAKVPAFADAVQRAKEIASKIRPGSGPTTSSNNQSQPPPALKRPYDFEDYGDYQEEPNQKKPFHSNMMDPGMAMASSTEIMMVPDKMVGLIIGRGGEQITRLQSESGCKIQMAQDSQGMQERQCTLTGPPAAIAQAKASIERIIANEGTGPPRGPGGPPMGMGGGHPGGPMGGGGGAGGMYEMMVPGHKVGLIIGKGGETIKQLQERSGAKIIIIQDSPEAAHEKPLRITGDPGAVEAAKELVTEILNQNDDRDMGGFRGGRGGGRGGMPRGRGGFMGGRGAGAPSRGRGGYGGWGGAPGGGAEYGSSEHTDYVTIPSNKCGLVIGKGGETIKSINSSTGAHCEVDKSAPPDAREKNFIIRGTPEAVERAKAMIMEKIGMPVTASTYGSSAYGSSAPSASWGGYQQQPGGYGGEAVNPATGQPDYSAQWAEYYRSMGMIREAEAIEQQMRGRPQGQPAAPAAAPGGQPGGPAANGTQNGADYSAQWAEYYRSIGKVKEAEAIEAQMKQKAATGGAGQFGGAPGAFYGGQGQGQSAGYPSGYAAAGYGGQD